VLALVLEGTRVLGLDVLMNGRDVLDRTHIVTVGALDSVGGADVGETGLGFLGVHGCGTVQGAAGGLQFFSWAQTTPVRLRKSEVSS